MFVSARHADFAPIIVLQSALSQIPLVTLLLVWLVTAPASALTPEQAKAQCNDTVGRSFGFLCMGPRRDGADLAPCMAKAKPKVAECIRSALGSANGRANVPLAIPKEVTPAVSEATMAQPPAFVPPPRTISDITAILDSERPDVEKIEKQKAAANAKPELTASRRDLALFYYNRGNAGADLGRVHEAIDDANRAIEAGRGVIDPKLMARLEFFVGLQYGFAGNAKQALAIFQAMRRREKGYLFAVYRHISYFLIQMGNIEQAATFLDLNLTLIREARTSGHPGWRVTYTKFGQSWEAAVDFHRALILEARGQFHEAEVAYRHAELRRRPSMKVMLSQEYPPPASQYLQGIDLMVLHQSRMKTRQGRLAEAEADARRALLSRLKDQGKFNSITPRYIMGLADVLVEQGRVEEAESLARVSLEINRQIGVPKDSQLTVQLLSALGGMLTLQRKP